MKRVNALMLALAVAGSAAGCQVEQKKEAELPEVDVKGGQMPDYDVKTPDVEVEMKKKQVEVPEVDVGTTSRTIEVPDVDVKMPEETKTDEARPEASR